MESNLGNLVLEDSGEIEIKSSIIKVIKLDYHIICASNPINLFYAQPHPH